MAYQDKLASYHALDFDDLVYFARATLHVNPAICRRWSDRFSVIQVDEMQDTHMSEYKVLRQLGQGSRNLALAGDFDQTIYEWRGSQPNRVLNLFEKDFPEARHFSFLTNYRTTRTLVDAAASCCLMLQQIRPSAFMQHGQRGDPIVVHFAPIRNLRRNGSQERR